MPAKYSAPSAVVISNACCGSSANIANRPGPRATTMTAKSEASGAEVLNRAAALIDWQKRASPRRDGGFGRGLAYVHYKHNETWVAMAMEAEIERS